MRKILYALTAVVLISASAVAVRAEIPSPPYTLYGQILNNGEFFHEGDLLTFEMAGVQYTAAVQASGLGISTYMLQIPSEDFAGISSEAEVRLIKAAIETPSAVFTTVKYPETFSKKWHINIEASAKTLSDNDIVEANLTLTDNRYDFKFTFNQSEEFFTEKFLVEFFIKSENLVTKVHEKTLDGKDGDMSVSFGDKPKMDANAVTGGYIAVTPLYEGSRRGISKTIYMPASRDRLEL